MTNDPYRWLAAEFFNVRYVDVTDEQRQRAKQWMFASVYNSTHSQLVEPAWKRALAAAGLK